MVDYILADTLLITTSKDTSGIKFVGSMEKKNCITVLLIQFIISGVVADSKYVREGYNVTFTYTTTVSVEYMNWEHITAGGITSLIAVNEDVLGSFQDKFSSNIPTEGTYRLTLFFFNSKTDLGSYRCFTGNSAISNSFTISLAEGPSTASVNGISPVFANGTNSLTLTCTHDTATPNVIYQWWRNGAEITGDSTSTLTVSPVQASDNGANITCTAMNSVYNDIQASDSVKLNIYYPANISIEVTQNTSEGDDVTVICSCHSNPDPTFTITGPMSRLTSSSSRLEIRNISRFDGGKYSCTAGNTYFTVTKTTTVTVKYPPDVRVTYENTTETDTGATITCTAAGIPDSYNFYPWKHIAPDGETVIRELRGNHTEGQYTLIFRDSVSYEDSGYYRCTVNNGITGLSPHLNQTKMSSYFIVEGPPKILEKEYSIHGDLGDAVNIKMQFYSVPEYTSVKWYILNGSRITDTQTSTVQATLETTFHGQSVNVPGYITTLKLDSVTENDFLSYRVVVNNTKGSLSFVKTLKGRTTDEPKSTPLGGIIGGVVGGLVVIVICIIVVVLFMRRRRLSTKEKKSDVETSNSYGSRNHLYPVEASTENPMYVKSDVSAEPEAVYSEVKKVNKLPATDVHSQDKKKGVKTATPHDKDVLVDGARGGENDYKNTASNKSNETEELRNADGLLYADLASAKRNRRDPPLIRGVENTTDYAAIDFTKRAPAPPQEDMVETTTVE